MSKRAPYGQTTHVDDPCPRCGATTRRPGLDTSDENATELPIISLCARCKYRFPEGAA